MSQLRVAALVAVVALTPARASGPSAGATPHAGVRARGQTDSAPFYAGLGDPDSLKAAMDRRLAAAQEKIDRLAAATGPRTVATTLRSCDDIRIDLDSVQAPSNLIGQAHPDERMREIADAANNRARAMAGDLVSNRAVYDALAAIDLSHADAQEKFYVQRELPRLPPERRRPRREDARAHRAAAPGSDRGESGVRETSAPTRAASPLPASPSSPVCRPTSSPGSSPTRTAP